MISPDPDHFLPGQTLPGTVYRVIDVIGSGGMGRVYRVEHEELGKEFVLKALHLHLSSRADLVGRLRNEWRALGKLNHPNIVQVTDAGQTSSGLPYYVMESLRGQTLAQMMTGPERLTRSRACQIIVEVLRALSAAHATGAIHRDIKPPNIFVAETGTVKLLDFGIAKLRDRAAKVVTAGGVSIGTPRYMAPEQAQGTQVDGRADIYAAGLVLYELLVGRGPFAHIRDPNELVMAHIGTVPERADHLDGSLPEEMGDLLQRWLSKEPGSRPRTAAMAEGELESLSAALFVAEQPDSDLTLERGYEARTLGAESGVTLGPTVPALEKQKIDSPISQEGAQKDESPAPTKTVEVVPASGPLRVGKKTLPLGSAHRELAESTGLGEGSFEEADAPVRTSEPPAPSSREPASARPSSDGPRASRTPPPLSWRPERGPASERILSPSRAIVGALVTSFVLAWAGVWFVSRDSGALNDAAPEKEGSADSAPENAAKRGPAAGASKEDSPAATPPLSPAAPPLSPAARSPAPPSSAEAEVPVPGEAEAKAAAAHAPAPAHDKQPASSPKTLSVRTPEPAPAPAPETSRPVSKPKSAGSSPLPGSGLW